MKRNLLISRCTPFCLSRIKMAGAKGATRIEIVRYVGANIKEELLSINMVIDISLHDLMEQNKISTCGMVDGTTVYLEAKR